MEFTSIILDRLSPTTCSGQSILFWIELGSAKAIQSRTTPGAESEHRFPVRSSWPRQIEYGPSAHTSPFESPRVAGTPGAACAGIPYPWGPSGLGGYFWAHFFLFKRPGAGSAAALRAAPRRWPGPAFAGGFGGQAREGIPVKGQACRLAWCHSLGTSGVTAAGVAGADSANLARRPAAARGRGTAVPDACLPHGQGWREFAAAPPRASGRSASRFCRPWGRPSPGTPGANPPHIALGCPLFTAPLGCLSPRSPTDTATGSRSIRRPWRRTHAFGGIGDSPAFARAARVRPDSRCSNCDPASTGWFPRIGHRGRYRRSARAAPSGRLQSSSVPPRRAYRKPP
jgi:hypothetical protein